MKKTCNETNENSRSYCNIEKILISRKMTLICSQERSQVRYLAREKLKIHTYLNIKLLCQKISLRFWRYILILIRDFIASLIKMRYPLSISSLISDICNFFWRVANNSHPRAVPIVCVSLTSVSASTIERGGPRWMAGRNWLVASVKAHARSKPQQTEGVYAALISRRKSEENCAPA